MPPVRTAAIDARNARISELRERNDVLRGELSRLDEQRQLAIDERRFDDEKRLRERRRQLSSEVERNNQGIQASSNIIDIRERQANRDVRNYAQDNPPSVGEGVELYRGLQVNREATTKSVASVTPRSGAAKNRYPTQNPSITPISNSQRGVTFSKEAAQKLASSAAAGRGGIKGGIFRYEEPSGEQGYYLAPSPERRARLGERLQPLFTKKSSASKRLAEGAERDIINSQLNDIIVPNTYSVVSRVKPSKNSVREVLIKNDRVRNKNAAPDNTFLISGYSAREVLRRKNLGQEPVIGVAPQKTTPIGRKALFYGGVGTQALGFNIELGGTTIQDLTSSSPVIINKQAKVVGKGFELLGRGIRIAGENPQQSIKEGLLAEGIGRLGGLLLGETTNVATRSASLQPIKQGAERLKYSLRPQEYKKVIQEITEEGLKKGRRAGYLIQGTTGAIGAASIAAGGPDQNIVPLITGGKGFLRGSNLSGAGVINVENVAGRPKNLLTKNPSFVSKQSSVADLGGLKQVDLIEQKALVSFGGVQEKVPKITGQSLQLRALSVKTPPESNRFFATTLGVKQKVNFAKPRYDTANAFHGYTNINDGRVATLLSNKKGDFVSVISDLKTLRSTPILETPNLRISLSEFAGIGISNSQLGGVSNVGNNRQALITRGLGLRFTGNAVDQGRVTSFDQLLITPKTPFLVEEAGFPIRNELSLARGLQATKVNIGELPPELKGIVRYKPTKIFNINIPPISGRKAQASNGLFGNLLVEQRTDIIPAEELLFGGKQVLRATRIKPAPALINIPSSARIIPSVITPELIKPTTDLGVPVRGLTKSNSYLLGGTNKSIVSSLISTPSIKEVPLQNNLFSPKQIPSSDLVPKLLPKSLVTQETIGAKTLVVPNINIPFPGISSNKKPPPSLPLGAGGQPVLAAFEKANKKYQQRIRNKLIKTPSLVAVVYDIRSGIGSPLTGFGIRPYKPGK